MRIRIDRDEKVPLYIQIKDKIKRDIYLKKLPKGYLLPSERKLSDILCVNRSTVVKAYQELKAEGLIDSGVGKGTYVIYEEEKSDDGEINEFIKVFYWDDLYSERIKQKFEDSIVRMMDIGKDQKRVSFFGGFPSQELYPTEQFKKIYAELSEDDMGKIFLHSPVEGYSLLKEKIRDLMISRGIKASSSEIMILSGSQQGLDLVVRTFINAGDVVLVEEPSFFAAIELFKLAGAKVISVPMEEDGMKVDVLEYLIKIHKPKLVYTAPTFQNPTGATMSLEKRYRLLNICMKHRLLIIEDDPYRDLRYEGEEIPAIKTLDRNNQVIYLSTFSKTIGLGLRTGWLIAPQEIVNKLSLLKQLTDIHVNTLSQHMMYKFLEKRYYEDHIEKVKKDYLEKRDLMVEQLRDIAGIENIFTIPKGGYYIWYKVSEKIESSLLIKESYKNGVIYMPGHLFYSKNSDNSHFLRLNYTYPKREEIILGVNALKKSIRRFL